MIIKQNRFSRICEIYKNPSRICFQHHKSIII
nr:MAG TPA: hypothetical protein [Caudoviricetes sp.]